MSDEGSFVLEGWKLKGSDWVYSNKKLLHGASDSDFEKTSIVIAKSEIERLHTSIAEDEEEQVNG